VLDLPLDRIAAVHVAILNELEAKVQAFALQILNVCSAIIGTIFALQNLDQSPNQE
jgi:hypothetical protein